MWKKRNEFVQAKVWPINQISQGPIVANREDGGERFWKWNCVPHDRSSWYGLQLIIRYGMFVYLRAKTETSFSWIFAAPTRSYCSNGYQKSQIWPDLQTADVLVNCVCCVFFFWLFVVDLSSLCINKAGLKHNPDVQSRYPSRTRSRSRMNKAPKNIPSFGEHCVVYFKSKQNLPTVVHLSPCRYSNHRQHLSCLGLAINNLTAFLLFRFIQID